MCSAPITSAVLAQMKLHRCWRPAICAGKFLMQDFTLKIFLSLLSGKKCSCQRSTAFPLAPAKIEFCQGRISSSLMWLHDCQCYTCGFVFTLATLPSRRVWRLRYEDNMSECVAKKTGVTERHYPS